MNKHEKILTTLIKIADNQHKILESLAQQDPNITIIQSILNEIAVNNKISNSSFVDKQGNNYYVVQWLNVPQELQSKIRMALEEKVKQKIPNIFVFLTFSSDALPPP